MNYPYDHAMTILGGETPLS